MSCGNCGAVVDHLVDARSKKCRFCGAPVVLPQEVPGTTPVTIIVKQTFAASDPDAIARAFRRSVELLKGKIPT